MDELAKLLGTTSEKKPVRVTVSLTEADMALLNEVKQYLGKSNVAEIARKGIRAGLLSVLDKIKPKVS